ncbi:lantibiotic dehydratase [Streptomyces sp. x-80]|uniref:lantibiotic dehydratase n=1 Tax=Streptomyces sp. x-80 TaxID=2789282 RepID=UPI00397EFB43
MRRLFDPHPVAMARVPLRPYQLGPAGGSGDDLLDEGVFLASRSAAQAAAEGTERGRVTRAAYDLRSRTRTTPHGVFAGVAPATFTAATLTARLGSAHRTVTTPSPAWLTEVADQLMREHPELLSALTLTAASAAVRRGDRLEVEHPAPEGARMSSVRATDVSLWLLDASRGGALAGDLLNGLLCRHPGADPRKATRAVINMIDTGLLLPDLPADLRDNPVQHLLDKLPPTALLRPCLARLDQLLARCDTYPPGTPQRRKLLEEARDLADEVHHTRRPLAVDTLADADFAVPPAVGEQAAEAASLLWRIGQRKGPLTDYHRRFCSLYGHQRLVPLLDVLDPVTGLGPPAPSDAIGTDEGLDERRTAALAGLLADALSTGRTEIVLDEQHVDQLTNPSPLLPPRTAEIHIQLLRDADRLRIAVCPGTGSQVAGAAPGRWIRWLPQLAPREDPDFGHGPMVAEIVCRPRTAVAGALAGETGAAPWRIPLDLPARPRDIRLDDLAVTTTGTHLQLWSTRHHRPVIPVLYNRLAPRLLPPAAYALHLLGHAGTRPWHPWNWGPLNCWPYTPRVRYRDVLLAPARWRLPEALTTAAHHHTPFEERLANWRTTTRLTPPAVLLAEEADRRLTLDLRQRDHRELLRRSIHRGTRILAEPFAGPEDLAVVDGPNGAHHVIDLVVPLSRRHTPHTPPTDPRNALRTPGTGTYLPGGEWLSAALAAPARLHNTVLTELAPLLNHLPVDVDRWFWLRYTTPALGPHLRLRFHATPHTLATDVQPRLSELSDHLRSRGLLGPGTLHLEPYEQEIERYGGPQAITAVERLFSTDSRLALAALNHTEDERLLIAAAGSAEIARTLAPEPLSALGPGHLTRDQRRHRDALREQLPRVPALFSLTGLATARATRSAALIAYRDTLPHRAADRCASDVIHMHTNRMLAVDPGAERLVRTLAADLLHRP